MTPLLEFLLRTEPSVLVSLIISLFGFLIVFRLERYKRELIRNEKKEKVAELFSYIPVLDGKEVTKEEMLRINQLILELSLYLPKNLVCDVSEHLADDEKRKNAKDCFARIRADMMFPYRRHLGLISKRFKNGDGLEGRNVVHYQERPKS